MRKYLTIIKEEEEEATSFTAWRKELHSLDSRGSIR
jgi:hypothetical protein